MASINTDLNSKTLLRYALKGLAVWLIVMFGIVWYTFDPKETFGALRNFPLSYIPLLLSLVCGSWFCSGTRLWVLSRAMGGRMSLYQALVTGLAAEFGVAATPGGVGGTVIRLVFMKRSGLSLTVGASILTADAVLDVSFFVLLIPFAVIVMGGDPSWDVVVDKLRSMPFAALAMAVVLFVLMLVLLLKKGGSWARWLEDNLENVAIAHKRRLASRLRYARWKSRNAFIRVFRTTRFLFQQHSLSLGIALALTAIQWLCRYGILPVVLGTFVTDVSYIPLIVVQGLLLVVSFVILLPGGGGAVDVITTLMLEQFVLPSVAGIIQIICRIFTYHLYLLAGGVVFFLTWGSLDRVFPPEKTKTG